MSVTDNVITLFNNRASLQPDDFAEKSQALADQAEKQDAASLVAETRRPLLGLFSNPATPSTVSPIERKTPQLK